MSTIDVTIQRLQRGISRGGHVATIGDSCDADLGTVPWAFDAVPSYGPGASVADTLPGSAPRQGPLPETYTRASLPELEQRIRDAKQTLGDRVVVLGHFYQRDEIVQFADYVGDSFQLARAATAHPEAEAIIFCGVHFMAETADILSSAAQSVILPNLAAGCSMADMADIDQVEACWAELEHLYADEFAAAAADPSLPAPVIPVTYMNSAADLKAFCGRHGGIVCTSSNARSVLEWAFARGRRVLFFPDQHLGRNTAKAMGVPLEAMPMWNPTAALGGNDADALRAAQVILWHGFCSVHKRFSVAQIEKARADFPDVRVIVHPECSMEVVDAADEAGSTDLITKAIAAAPDGTTFAVGTEINLVHRLAEQYPQHHIFCLDPVVCPCSTMYRIHPAYLAWVLEELVAGRVVNQISVPTRDAADAKVALERMLANAPGAATPTPTPGQSAHGEQVDGAPAQGGQAQGGQTQGGQAEGVPSDDGASGGRSSAASRSEAAR